jgi:hypothetical protein
MDILTERETRYSFSGHDSFQCRQFWLKKGFDFRERDGIFNDDAVVELGVGKNMVTSVRYWLKAFDITRDKDVITDFGRELFGDDGLDPFLEDDGSIWLLHYYLVKKGYASIYSLIFNEFRREKIEFSKESFLAFAKRKAETTQGFIFNGKTVSEDFDVFRKMYLSNTADKPNEEGFSGLLSELGLVTKIERRLENKKEELFSIENESREKVPAEIFLYTILDNEEWGTSININNLEHDLCSPGAVFAINRHGIIAKINECVEKYDWITYNDHGGVKELQLKTKPEPITILRKYYGQA